MNHRKYRVVCLLNILERRLYEMRRDGASPSAVLRLLEVNAASISMLAASADKRYVRDRIEHMLDAHFHGIDVEGARRLLAEAVSPRDRGLVAREMRSAGPV